jgi:hypothetical protein
MIESLIREAVDVIAHIALPDKGRVTREILEVTIGGKTNL